jgi:hypothetical protein
MRAVTLSTKNKRIKEFNDEATVFYYSYVKSKIEIAANEGYNGTEVLDKDLNATYKYSIIDKLISEGFFIIHTSKGFIITW